MGVRELTGWVGEGGLVGYYCTIEAGETDTRISQVSNPDFRRGGCSQPSQEKNPHDLQFLAQRLLHLVQHRHRQHEDDEVRQHVESGNDRRCNVDVYAVVRDPDRPIRPDRYACETRGDGLSQAVADDEDADGPEGDGEWSVVEGEDAVVER